MIITHNIVIYSLDPLKEVRDTTALWVCCITTFFSGKGDLSSSPESGSKLLLQTTFEHYLGYYRGQITTINPLHLIHMHIHSKIPLLYVESRAHRTVQLIVDHILKALQPLQDRLPVHQVGNFAISRSQSLVGDASDLDQLLGAVLYSAVDREQDDADENQNVHGQQSFYFACHSHGRGWMRTGG